MEAEEQIIRRLKDIIDPQRVTALASKLKNKSYKTLPAETLTLSVSLLRALNVTFSLIAQHFGLGFQAFKFQSKLLRELQLMHDFFQTTTILCITQTSFDPNLKVPVDLRRFRSLLQLEIRNVRVEHIKGVQELRSQLVSIICEDSVNSIADIIERCGADNSNSFIWSKLNCVEFSNNNLHTIDSSLRLVQHLQKLNISRNQLTSSDVDAIKLLPNLKSLNLSFNCLTSIPCVHPEAHKGLHTLTLSKNSIQDLTGLVGLDGLMKLDLSNNCLWDYSCLAAISELCVLYNLNLSGNPIAGYRNYRKETVKNLNKSIAGSNFIFDDKRLSKGEQRLIGSCQIMSPITFSLIETFDQQNSKILVNKNRKKIKPRIAPILDLPSSNSCDEFLLLTISEINKNYLDTKRQIDEAREKFGIEWLQNKNDHVIRCVLGHQRPIFTRGISLVIPRMIITNILHRQNRPEFLRSLSKTVNEIMQNSPTMSPLTPCTLDQQQQFDFTINSTNRSTVRVAKLDGESLRKEDINANKEDKNKASDSELQ